MCDRHDGWTVFYEVYGQNAGIYLDLGLTLFKIGEEARIPSKPFSLKKTTAGNYVVFIIKLKEKAVPLRSFHRAKSVHFFRVQEISDAWLESKNTKE